EDSTPPVGTSRCIAGPSLPFRGTAVCQSLHRLTYGCGARSQRAPTRTVPVAADCRGVGSAEPVDPPVVPAAGGTTPQRVGPNTGLADRRDLCSEPCHTAFC